MARSSKKVLPFILPISGRFTIDAGNAPGFLHDAANSLVYGDNDDNEDFDFDELIEVPRATTDSDILGWALYDGIFLDMLERSMSRFQLETGLLSVINQGCEYPDLASLFEYTRTRDRMDLVLGVDQKRQLTEWIEINLLATLKVKFEAELKRRTKNKMARDQERAKRDELEIENMIRAVERAGHKVVRSIPIKAVKKR